jgi:aromatic ring-opening dioxygenase catalytic subunit (LigB family)
MGEIVFVAKCTHVPTMPMSEHDGPAKGKRQAAIDGHVEICRRARFCCGEGSVHDTAMLYGALGWDSHTGKCEVMPPCFTSSVTGQTNVIFPL